MAHILDGDGLRTRAGWCCPGCSRCYGPQVDECPHCPDGETGKGPAFLPSACPAPPNKPPIPAIFVPLRSIPEATPKRVRELQDMLDLAVSMSGNLVDGKFSVLPPGAKILPAHPGREWVRVIPPMMPGLARIVRAAGEWADVVPGFQCRVPFGAGEYHVEFRLTPADGSP